MPKKKPASQPPPPETPRDPSAEPDRNLDSRPPAETPAPQRPAYRKHVHDRLEKIFDDGDFAALTPDSPARPSSAAAGITGPESRPVGEPQRTRKPAAARLGADAGTIQPEQPPVPGSAVQQPAAPNLQLPGVRATLVSPSEPAGAPQNAVEITLIPPVSSGPAAVSDTPDSTLAAAAQPRADSKTGAGGSASSAPVSLALTKPYNDPTLQPGSANLLLEFLDTDPNRQWTEDEQLLVEQVADQLSLALENARLFEQATARAEEMALINRVVGTVAASLDLKHTLNVIVQELARAISLEHVAISLVGGASSGARESASGSRLTTSTSLELVASTYAFDQTRSQPVAQPSGLKPDPLDHPIIQQALHSNAPLIIYDLPNLSSASPLGPVPEILSHPGALGLVILPIYGSAAPQPGASALTVGTSAQDRQAIGLTTLYITEPGRSLAPDELRLAQTIVSQASTAVQNARLYAAEQRRRQIADTLRNIAQVISSTLSLQQVSELLLDQTHKLIDFQTASIQIIEGDQRRVLRSIRINEIQQLPEVIPDAPDTLHRPISQDPLVNMVVSTRQPLVIADTYNDDRWDVLPATAHIHAWICAPMTVGDQTVGLIFLDHILPNAFNEETAQLLSAVASQGAIAIQNARLFDQSENARQALTLRERYQTSVARSVALLTERGTAALSEVLTILGEAAGASRAYYFQTERTKHNLYWRPVAEWCAPGVSSQQTHPLIKRLSVRHLSFWREPLEQRGILIADLADFPERERSVLEAIGTRSLLQFAVRGQHPTPGFIGFDQVDYQRQWGEDEISALMTAASALSNTIAREDLLSQLQVSLSQSQESLEETETLYRANAGLSEASNYDQILEVLRTFTILGHTSADRVSLSLFDRIDGAPSTTGDTSQTDPNQPALSSREAAGAASSAAPPEWIIPVARWNAQPTSEPPNPRYPLSAWSTTNNLLNPDQIVFISDVEQDPRIDATGRAVYIQRLRARSALFIPLNVAGKWIGHIIATYSQPITLLESERRRLTSLSSQAAVAVEGLRLLKETLQRNEEQAALNRIISAASRSLELENMLGEILDEVLATTNADAGLISLARQTPAGATPSYDQPRDDRLHSPNNLELSAASGLPESLLTALRLHGFASHPAQVVYERAAPLVISDFTLPVTDERLAAVQLGSLLTAGFLACLGVPLLSKGQPLGVLCLFTRTPIPPRPEYYALLQAVGTQTGVAVENASLFLQTQDALSETAALYNASAELNAAESYDDVLATLRQQSLLTNADKLVSIQLFDAPTSASQGPGPQYSLPLTTLSNLPPGALSTRYPLNAFHRTYLAPGKSALSSRESPGGFSESAASAGSPIFIEDLATDPRLDDDTRTLYTRRFQGRSAIFIPLIVAGKWIGFVDGVFSRPARMDETATRRLIALARQVAVAVQNLNSIELAQRRAQEAQQRSDELSIINRIVSAVSASIDLQTSLDAVATQLGEALNVQTGIALLDEKRQLLVLTAAYSPTPGAENPIGVELPIQGNPSTERVFTTRQPLVIQDAQTNPLTAPIHHLLASRHVQALLIIPLITANRVIGTVGLDILDVGRTFTEDEIRLASAIVLQAAAAIENARLFSQTEQALAETETLFQASSSLNRASAFPEILAALTEFTILGQGSSDITINLFDQPWTPGQPPEWINVIARRSRPQARPSELSRYRFDTLPSLETLLNPDQPTIIHDLLIDPRIHPELRRLLTEGYADPDPARAIVFAPLLVAGQWIGFIDSSYTNPIDFPERDLRLLRAISIQAAVAVQNLRLLEESRRRAGQLQTAAEIARDTSTTLDLDSLLSRSVQLIIERFDYYHASVFLIDDEGINAVVRASTGLAGEEMQRQRHTLPVGSRSIIGNVTATGRPLVVNDVTQDPNHRPNPLLPLTRAELGLPLNSGSRIIGALDVQSTRPNAFTPDDITVLQTLADQLAVALENARSYQLAQQAYEEMREVDRLKSQFLANMSHELRTPLNSIIGFSRVILKGIDGPITDLQQQDLSAIYNSGQHLLNLINDVLDLSKIEAGKMELTFEDDVDLSDLIQSVMSTAIGLVKDKPIQLKRDLAPDLPPVRADPLKIRQVIINLLSNAAKFTEEGAITVYAHPRRTPKGSLEVLIQVSDTGPGIAEEDLPKLFKPFSQVDGSLTRKAGGSGLGLSICQYLVQMHGGHIGVDSTDGQGSTFFFSLPSTLAPEPLTPPATDGIVDGADRLVLVVDDERQITNLYERYLTSHGYSVLAVTDPTHLISQAIQLQPYAITLDIMLPDRDGWQLLDELKHNPLTRHIPVIICSILSDQQKGFSMGAVDYLTKPILEDELIHAIQRINGHGLIRDILAVDDDPDVLRWYEKVFQQHPQIHLHQADGPEQALQEIQRQPPHAILLDLFMPDPWQPEPGAGQLGGITLLERLRSDPELRHLGATEIPVLVLTAGDLDEDQRARLNRMAQAMLRKGLVDEEQLLNNISQALEQFSPAAVQDLNASPAASAVDSGNEDSHPAESGPSPAV